MHHICYNMSLYHGYENHYSLKLVKNATMFAANTHSRLQKKFIFALVARPGIIFLIGMVAQ
jgi:penicillin-binding protein-related factor A (putative recombinase)